MKKIYLIFLVAFVLSCSDEPTEKVPVSDKRSIGVQINNEMIGGLIYTDPNGKQFAYRSFRPRIINDTTIPIELTINFNNDSISLLPKSNRYLRVFLLPDT